MRLCTVRRITSAGPIRPGDVLTVEGRLERRRQGIGRDLHRLHEARQPGGGDRGRAAQPDVRAGSGARTKAAAEEPPPSPSTSSPPPDHRREQPTATRGVGDHNPIHVDPSSPATPRPAGDHRARHVHDGLASKAVLDAVAGGDPAGCGAIKVRFSKPVFRGRPHDPRLVESRMAAWRLRLRDA